jgi:hypothetical protein
MKTQRLFRLFSIAVLVVAFLGAHTTSASASVTFVVRVAYDGYDANLGDGVCATTSGRCTLRAAIQEANFNPGADTIEFQLAGGGVHVMSILGSPLPGITEQLTLDGTSQPNCTVPCIVLSGALIAGTNTGLSIATNNSVIKGFIITSWGGDGIRISGNDNIVKSNDIGFWPDNPASLPNGDGIAILGSNNRIGGTLASERNVISGNTWNGIILTGKVGAADSGNVIQGNYIGTNASGNAALGNGSAGISVLGPLRNTTIGGATTGARNVISGNLSAGIQVAYNVINTIIQGNFIGTNAVGNGALGNGPWGGIWIFGGATRTQIGGTAANMGNKIAYNAGAGITIVEGATLRNSIRRNSIYQNANLGIDLGDDGVTVNDTLDPDNGPNGLQNFPIINSATSATRIIVGQLRSRASQAYALDFFSSPTCDASRYGEGKTFLGSADVTTNPTGVANFSVPMTVAFPVGSILTATATDAAGNTSEFSLCRAAN